MKKTKNKAPRYLSKTRLYIPSIMLYSHTVTDSATHRSITNYDPRRRLRTPTSTLSGATKQTATNFNGFVVADSSSNSNNNNH